jgi:hypothetical protein
LWNENIFRNTAAVFLNSQSLLVVVFVLAIEVDVNARVGGVTEVAQGFEFQQAQQRRMLLVERRIRRANRVKYFTQSCTCETKIRYSSLNWLLIFILNIT